MPWSRPMPSPRTTATMQKSRPGCVLLAQTRASMLPATCSRSKCRSQRTTILLSASTASCLRKSVCGATSLASDHSTPKTCAILECTSTCCQHAPLWLPRKRSWPTHLPTKTISSSPTTIPRTPLSSTPLAARPNWSSSDTTTEQHRSS